MTTRTILLNPGPVTLSDRVRRAMTQADWCHREAEFASLTKSINRRLAEIYADAAGDYASVLLTGSGSAAVEAMLSTFAPTDSKSLVVANGVYGERMATMLAAMGRPAETIKAEWDAPIDLHAVEERLATNAEITHVVTVHHETTTGRLNDVAAIGALCHKYERKLLLDAVSSFGAEEIHFADWNLDAVAGTANKCLHGVPGLSYVVAREELLAAKTSGIGSVYLDLHRYYHTQHGDGYSPFTLSVQVAFALDAALDEIQEQGGWKQRRARYQLIADSVRKTLAEFAVTTFIAADEYSAVMCSYRLPTGTTYAALHDQLKAQGFIIYAGQGHFAADMFRIAHMGDIGDDDLDRLNQALAAFFNGLT